MVVARRRNNLLLQAATEANLRCITLSARSQGHKEEHLPSDSIYIKFKGRENGGAGRVAM